VKLTWRERLAGTAERVWYRPRHPLSLLLAPLGWLYCGIARLRAAAYGRGWLFSGDCGAPVIVVGNLSVGGTGKTPLVIWLVAHLRERGLTPGVVTRGYGGRGGTGPWRARVTDSAAEVGDEALLLARRAECPVVVGRDRLVAARMLVETMGCDLVITDDGLQHYRLQRNLEIVVVDAQRGHGNRRCLPAGPLREPVARARRADLILRNGAGDGSAFSMTLEPDVLISLADPQQTRTLASFAGQRVTAVAGIGNPRRFFTLLRSHGLDVRPLAYPDHHPFGVADIEHWPAGPVLMTEKDAVKVQDLSSSWLGKARWAFWYLPVMAHPSPNFIAALDRRLEALQLPAVSVSSR
jgi:tetraacyldisaccharide 4'-kinase